MLLCASSKRASDSMTFQQKAIAILRSSKFFWATLVLFVLQGVFFALAVNPSLQSTAVGSTYLDRSLGLVPDGNRHIAAIYHFAAQPLAQGPFIHEMSDKELMMGDLVRFPSYFYYYLLSFPVRAALAIGASDLVIVYLVRFIGLGFGVLALIVFRRIVREIRAGPVIANVATFGLAMTGAFAYFAPAENYDMLALLLWFYFVYASVKLFVRRDPTQLYWMVTVGMFLSITKYTYLPFAGVLALVAIGLYVRNSGGASPAWSETKRRFVARWNALKTWRRVALVLVALVGLVLFVERIGVNIVQYHSVSPNCAVVHDRDSCMSFTVYNRNVTRLEAVEAGETWTRDFHFFEYTGEWLARYYPTLYYYMGHIWVYYVWPVLWVSGGVMLALLLVALGYLLVRKRRVIQGQAEWYILGLVGLITAGQYSYNAMLFIKYSGQMYGHQGRYLLPALGFMYVLVLLVLARAYRSLPTKHRRVAFIILFALGLTIAIINGAFLNFFIHADSPQWYSEIGRWLVPDEWFTGR